ncbi:hypothetical protein, partial [Oribacterium sp. Sow4_G1_1]|uniref:hypothetical protein n=1 Tax=Oribacterium sp. Sow4_G1_1 TaxID=3438794 RepID=UPI003F9B0087
AGTAFALHDTALAITVDQLATTGRARRDGIIALNIKKPSTSLCLSSKFDTLNMVLIPEVRGTRRAKRVPRTFFLFNLMTVYRSIS